MAPGKRKSGKRRAYPPRPTRKTPQITQTAREAQALSFRLAGASYEQIALQMGYRTRAGPWKAVQEALRKTIQEPADRVRDMELARLDRMLVSIWQTAIQPGSMGHLECLDRVLKIMAQRAWYILGLKVPDKIASTTPDGTQAASLVQAAPSDQFFLDLATLFQQLGPQHVNGAGAAVSPGSDDL